MDEAKQIIQERYNLLNINYDWHYSYSLDPGFAVKNLYKYIKRLGITEILDLCDAQYIYKIQKSPLNAKAKYVKIVSALQQQNLSPNFTHVFDHDSILSLAQKERPASDGFLKYYYQVLTIQFLKNGMEQEAIKMLRTHFRLITPNEICLLKLNDGTKFHSTLIAEAQKNGQNLFMRNYYELEVRQFIRENKPARAKAYISKLKETNLLGGKPLISFDYIEHKLSHYPPQKNSKREQEHNAVISLTKALKNSPDLCNPEALIGLLLLVRKDIASEYKWFSPRKGLFFGSRLYSLCEDTLLDLGVNLKNMTTDEEQRYFSILNEARGKVDDLKEHPYFQTAMGQKLLPTTMPLIPEPKQQSPIIEAVQETVTIKEPLSSPIVEKELFVEERAILMGEKDVSGDPNILRTEEGFYRVSTQIGKGGWGTVHAGTYYYLKDGKVQEQSELAIKIMNSSSVSLDKECALLSKAYSEHHFASFKQKSKSYMIMPRFSGTPLDECLLSSQGADIPFRQRQSMALGLFSSLQEIHKHRVIHNDIKPKNILFDPRTKALSILDFGCAEEQGTALKYKNIDTAKFAIEYMPPEYHHGSTAETATDIYSMTLSVAEVLGVNKKQVVEDRMERALKALTDDSFKKQLRTAFQKLGTLDEALFSATIGSFHETIVFEQFIKNYVLGCYDFASYQEKLGAEAINLLNAMQSQEPNNRPSLENCITILKAAKSDEQMSVFEKQNYTLFARTSEEGTSRPQGVSLNTPKT
jgi:serine/threonine protein kinase